ncbi:MAG TPA: DUF4340 domain-containing protein [Patescibacteria group bacterium]|nr:DUF4340 domain-containing protein [Patescibacteria group bacterium]
MKKTTARFSKLFILLFFLVLVFILITQKSVLFPRRVVVFPLLKKESMNKLIFIEAKNKITVEKKNNRWMIGDFPTDSERIDQILTAIATLKKDDIASQNKKKYPDFGVEGSKKIEFDKHILYIGDSGRGISQNYFRADTDPFVYRTSSDFSTFFSLSGLKDLSTHSITNEEAVDQVSLTWGRVELDMIKKKNEWVVNNKKALKERIDFLINDLKTLKGDAIFKKDEIDATKLPVEMNIFIKENGKSKESTLYRKDALSKENTEYYFYQKESPFIYTIPPSYVAGLKKEEKDLIKE